MSLNSILDARIIVCAGAGGVGKTSVSAAIGLEAASRGKKTIVLTIDPAKRLANSLGLQNLTNERRRIPKSKFKAAGLEPGELDAMMLDTKTTFDELIYKYAKTPVRAERIIENRFYQAISGALSGTHEYMAMEKLYELESEQAYDLIVIDTPPTRNALDFLESPKKMTSFLEGRILRWFLLPAIGGGKGLFKVANFAAVQFFRALRRIIGSRLLEDMAEFVRNFEGMYEGFKQRAQAVYDLLRLDSTVFVVVTSASDQSVDEALFFASTLRGYRFNFGGLIVNRVHPRFDTRDLPDNHESPVVDALVRVARGFGRVTEREEKTLTRLEREVPTSRWARIPYLTEDVVDVAALAQIGRYLFI